jgi:hypothetical protein
MNYNKIKTLILALISSTSILAQNEPIGKKGIPTIIDFFNEKPIVALGETHGHVQLYDFLSDLVQSEGFYKNVDDILIESGNSLYQKTLDKYIFGENVDYEDLQKIWMNTTQSPVDPWSIDVYFNFLKTIRDLNTRIDKKYRIRVIAADPPISWKDVHSNDDYLAAMGSRDEYFAQMVINEVLSKKRKALLINGGAHFGNHSPTKTKVNQRIEKVYPNSVVVVLAKSGIWTGTEEKEQKLNWSSGTIVKVKDTWIGLHPGPRRVVMAPPADNNSNSSSPTSTNSPTQISSGPPSKYKRQDYFDYLLYLGSSKNMTYGNIDASIYTSKKLWNELNRRSMIRFNHKLTEASRKTGELRPEAYN